MEQNWDSLSSSQELILSALLLLIIVIALTGICSVFLWCHLFLLKSPKIKKKIKEQEMLLGAAPTEVETLHIFGLSA
uniref:Small integral membrane protein 24 n=1 Tax=Heterorhabditis bacteriophora TaxID=37862 RepID=A0A1I7WP47_HETBA